MRDSKNRKINGRRVKLNQLCMRNKEGYSRNSKQNDGMEVAFYENYKG